MSGLCSFILALSDLQGMRAGQGEGEAVNAHVWHAAKFNLASRKKYFVWELRGQSSGAAFPTGGRIKAQEERQ